MSLETASLPSRFIGLKGEIAASHADFQQRLTNAWVDVLEQLDERTNHIIKRGPSYIPQVNFKDLANLKPEQIDDIKRKGSVVIKDVVDDAEAMSWKASLDEFVKANPNIDGFPSDDKQFFELYWTKAQVLARSHPNVLAASSWLNNLYHVKSGVKLDGVDLSVSLSYADRFRIRHPGGHWDRHPPHVDGGSIERWEDPVFRTCFADILNGNWRQHDPYDLEGRLDARTSLYGRPNQSTVFRTFQGWLAMSETAPSQGTLRVFPDVLLSNAYIMMRPFFRPVVSADSQNLLDAKNWEYDISSPEFHGIYANGGGFAGPRPTSILHPHMKLDKTMTSVPTVSPGDMVFWHCDVIHAVEEEHTGDGDSAVLYIPAVPLTPQNAEYVQKQRECFLQGQVPPDFPRVQHPEENFIETGKQEDIVERLGRVAMGLPVEVA